MEKITWIESIIESASAIKVEGPSADLYDKIQQKIARESITFQWGISVAAAVLMLIGVNLFYVLEQKNKPDNTLNNQEKPYISISNQLYNNV